MPNDRFPTQSRFPLKTALLGAACACSCALPAAQAIAGSDSLLQFGHAAVSYVGFSGTASGNALSSGTPGYAAEFELNRPWKIAALFARARFEYAQSTNTFADGNLLRQSLNFRYTGLLAGTGGRINLLPLAHTTTYVGAMAQIGYAQIQLPRDPSYSVLDAQSSAFGIGYQYHAGIEFRGARDKGLAFFVEAGKRVFRANLQGAAPFGLDSWILNGGVVW